MLATTEEKLLAHGKFKKKAGGTAEKALDRFAYGTMHHQVGRKPSREKK